MFALVFLLLGNCTAIDGFPVFILIHISTQDSLLSKANHLNKLTIWGSNMNGLFIYLTQLFTQQYFRFEVFISKSRHPILDSLIIHYKLLVKFFRFFNHELLQS